MMACVCVGVWVFYFLRCAGAETELGVNSKLYFWDKCDKSVSYRSTNFTCVYA